MKKILSVIALSLLALGASAQQKGRFETHDLDGFKLHVYYTLIPQHFDLTLFISS